MININFSEIALNSTAPNIYACKGANMYSVECLNRLICPQISQHFIKMGIIIVIIYVLSSWLLNWYFSKGYLKYFPPNNKFFGNFEEIETRAYWELWINKRISNFMLAYIIMVVYLSIKL